MNDITIIGIAGGSASGKTTVASKIKEEFHEDVELICHDYYYLAHNDITLEQRANLNYDHPNAFDTERLISDIKQLKQGIAIERPVYSYTEHTRLEETVRVEPKKVIIIEGFLIFENPELLKLMDIKIFVDTDADERLIRRILRDVKERGRNLESVITQYSTTVKPMHEQFVEPSKRHADLIIPYGGENEIALSMLMDKIRTMIS